MRFAPYYRHTCTLISYTGRGPSGDPSYGPPRKIMARVEGHTRTIINRDGENVAITTRVFTVRPIKPQDVIEFNGERLVIQSASACCTLSGVVDHYEGLC